MFDDTKALAAHSRQPRGRRYSTERNPPRPGIGVTKRLIYTAIVATGSVGIHRTDLAAHAGVGLRHLAEYLKTLIDEGRVERMSIGRYRASGSGFLA